MHLRLLALLSFISLASAGRIVCYFLSWPIYRGGGGQYKASDVDPNLCTHINYFNIGLNDNGTVAVMDDYEFTSLQELDHLKSLKTINPDLKIMVTLGGWTEGSERFSAIAADPLLRETLVTSILEFLEKYDFDGIDLDWEYPTAQEGSDPDKDPSDFVTLVTQIGTSLKGTGKIFSLCVSGVTFYIYTAYPQAKPLVDAVDYLNIKTLDYHGNWENFTGINAPLYGEATDDPEPAQNVNTAIKRWIAMGVDTAKMNLAIGFYGRAFTLADPSVNGLNAPVLGPASPGPWTSSTDGYWGYNEICYFKKNFTYVWDEDQQVPYSYAGEEWVGYDDVKSVQAKVEYVNDMGLGGVYVYSLDTDDFAGNCGDKYPLLTTINKNLA